VHCSIGGCTAARHNGLAREIGSLVHATLGVTPRFEQHIPHLDRTVADASTGATRPLAAILDVVYDDPDDMAGLYGGQVLIDVAVVSAMAGDAARVANAGRRDGVAAQRACGVKLSRYGETVVPFVVEVGGRPSEAAKAWLRHLLPRISEDAEEAAIRGADAWRRISCVVQRYVALQLRRAEAL